MSPHITEFPLFTFLFADLHAHMMAIPFTLLVIGLGLNLAVGLRKEGWLWSAISCLALGLALGSLWVINSWDYPSYLLLVLALLALAAYLRSGTAEAKAGLLLGLALLAIVGSIALFLPFHQAYETFNTGLEASKWRTPLDRYIGIYGLFLFIVVSFLLYQLRPGIIGFFSDLAQRRLPSGRSHGAMLVALGPGLLLVLFLAVAGYWTGVVLMAALWATGLAGWQLLSSAQAGDEAGAGPGIEKAYTVVPLLLLGMGLSISIGLDFVRVTGDIGRMNTVFKYYLEVWVLFSLAAAYMLWRLLDSGFLRSLVPTARGVWVGVLIMLLGSSLIYTVLGTKDRLTDRFAPGPLTLDGEAFLNSALYGQSDQILELKWDLAAIRWLQDNAQGSPVVLEAHGEQYHWNARIASYTGLPTVLGWPWHQTQQRTPYSKGVFKRAAHITEMYNTIDQDRAEELMRGYQVKYIVLGELERIYYQERGLAKFALMEEQGRLEQVFENSGVTVYRTSWDQ
jgi:YYY domain-containing protein